LRLAPERRAANRRGKGVGGRGETLKTTLYVVGKVKAPFADADTHYRKLLGRYQEVEVVEVADDASLLKRLPGEGTLVALDRRGREMDSMDWSMWLQERRLEAPALG